MKKLIIPLLISLSLLTSCDSSNQNNSSNINNNSNKETINNNFDTPSNIDEVDNQKLINETKDYIDQLNKLESELKETEDERYSSPVTLDLIEAANDEYKIWDDKLNEIYSVIIKDLPNDKANELIQEELVWIEIRDEKGDAEAKKNEGGSIAPLNRIMSFIESTKERCYDLVNKYM